MTIEKTVVVTGAARGIGLATAHRFLSEGYNVAFLDNNRETLQATVAQINTPDRILKLDCDVSSDQQVSEAIGKVIEKFGRVDALVNNAGIADFMPVTETSFEVWQNILATNLNGPFLCAQACIPYMIEQGGGAIVNITSISGLRASTLRTAYGTSKAGLAHLTKQLSAELGQHNIRVNSVAPGPIDTAMSKKVHTPEIRADYYAQIPLDRYGDEKEVANVIYFLCSDEASFVTGQEICADGGFDTTGIGLTTLRGQR